MATVTINRFASCQYILLATERVYARPVSPVQNVRIAFVHRSTVCMEFALLSIWAEMCKSPLTNVFVKTAGTVIDVTAQ